jgi:hypothetical protein
MFFLQFVRQQGVFSVGRQVLVITASKNLLQQLAKVLGFAKFDY